MTKLFERIMAGMRLTFCPSSVATSVASAPDDAYSIQKHFQSPVLWLKQKIIFKPGARGRRPLAPGFLKLLWFARRYVCVCVCVCPPPRPLITSGVIWCDIGRVRLVKQVLRLFPAFNYFIRHLPSIKWMGMAI